MQYTGLKDKNGTEIYEGDVITIKHFEDYEPSKHKVVYCAEDGYPAFEARPIICDDMNTLSWAIAECDVEVIGNIYEHPELIKTH